MTQLFRTMTLVLAICGVVFIPISESFGQSRRTRQRHGRAARGRAMVASVNIVKATPSAGGHLPYKVEIGDGITPPGFAVTLAEGAFTVVRCSEPGLNLVFGNPLEIEYQESVDGQQQYQLYLKPKRAGIYTNVGIEMPSGLVTFFVRSISVKGGARVGDFNGEVIIRPSGYHDEMAQAKARLTEMEKKLREAEARSVTVEAAANVRIAAARSDDQREALTALETITQSLKSQRPSFTAEQVRVRIAQVGSMARRPKSLWTVFSIENRDRRVLTLEDVRVEGARVSLGTTGARQIAARGKGRVAVYLEHESEPPRQLTFVVNGTDVTVPLRP
ncbi:MAG: hypothetical protein M3430_07270 [Acidobacteriota bacterium]|nr:hypothetical protein [Acidobacteriota bacterium]